MWNGGGKRGDLSGLGYLLSSCRGYNEDLRFPFGKLLPLNYDGNSSKEFKQSNKATSLVKGSHEKCPSRRTWKRGGLGVKSGFT